MEITDISDYRTLRKYIDTQTKGVARKIRAIIPISIDRFVLNYFNYPPPHREVAIAAAQQKPIETAIQRVENKSWINDVSQKDINRIAREIRDIHRTN